MTLQHFGTSNLYDNNAITKHKPHYPFDLPDGWCWLQLDEVADIARGGSPRPISQFITDDPYGVNWIKIGDTEKDGKYINTCAQKIIKEGVKRSRVVKKGDFLLTNSMSFGRPYILNVDGCIHDGWLVISPIGKPFEINFLYYLLSSSFAYSQFSEKAGGAVVSNLNIEKVAHSLFPLPPLDEQKRIVVEIERILDAIEIVNDSTHELSLAISNVKAKVLELAISGRLVPQDPADEPAEVLLKRVNPNAVVSADTSHYALPSNWVWVKGKDLFLPMKSTTPKGDTFKYIDIDSIDNKNQCISAIKVLPIEKAPSRASRYTEKNNVLFSMVRPYLRNIALVTEDECIASTGFYVCRQRECLDHNYLYYLMTSRYVVDGLNMFMKGDNSPSINKGHIDEFDFPLPPLNEQKRIVAKVAELFAQIDTIQQSLE